MSLMVTLTFSPLRKCQTVFQSSCTLLCFEPQYVRIPISSHSCPHLLLSVLLVIAIWLVSSGISLVGWLFAFWFFNFRFPMANDVEYLLIISHLYIFFWRNV